MPFSSSFAKQAAVVCLLAFAILELTSLLGVSPSLASILSYPWSFALSAVLVFFSLLGMYGIIKQSDLGEYFSLFTPIAELILVFSYLIGAFVEGGSFQMMMLRVLPVASLGIVCVFSLSKVLSYSVVMLMRAAVPGSNPDASAPDYAVEVIDVTKIYAVGTVVVPAINGLTMNVKKGEFVAVMGPSGCGKSTLLNLIGALDRPTSGHVLIDGIDISQLGELGLAQLRNEKVGFVFQAYNLINRSNVLRNVELPMLVKGVSREQRIQKIDTMLRVVGLDNMTWRKPKTLSGGEQQRVAIARALVNNPRIVLADEPTGNLDSKAGNEILSFLKNTNQETGTTVIMVTHNREAAEMANRVIYLKDGKIEREEVVRRN